MCDTLSGNLTTLPLQAVMGKAEVEDELAS